MDPERKERVAFFGGSFNPPHVGHVLGVVYALSVAPIDRVLVVPVYRHPFSKHLAPFTDRLAMCRDAVGWIPNVTISTVEEDLGGESLTLRTLEHLTAAHPEWSLRLLVGSDVLGDLHKWHRWDRVAALAPPLVLGRKGAAPPFDPQHEAQPGVTLVGDPSASVLPEVSSTEIRAALAAGDVDPIRDLVPRAVIDHIVRRGLYGVAGALP